MKTAQVLQAIEGRKSLKNEATKEMRDNIKVLLFKKPTDADLKEGQLVCYQNRDGVYAHLGKIDLITTQDGVKNYSINTAMGTYLASELRLTILPTNSNPY
jgi:hypothetical protein